MQIHKARTKGRDKGVAACQGNRAIARTKVIVRTKAKKQQARAIAKGKGNRQDTHFCTSVFQDFSRPRPGQ